MSVYEFLPAFKPAGWARVALAGAPGSGKKFTALRLAQGFGGVTGVVDTEQGAISEYAHLYDFLTLPMHAFGPEQLIEVLAVAADQRIDNLIISNLSAFWSGPDGMLEAVDRAIAAAGGRDKGAGWNAMRPVERNMTAALLHYPGNVIATLRTKVEWVTERDEQTGQMVTRQVGTKPDQRDGITYDFGVALTMDAGVGTITKSHYPPLTGRTIRHPGEDLADEISKCVSDGAVGDRFNPVDVQDWARAEDRTVEELRRKYIEAKATPAHAAAKVLDDRGYLITLPEFIHQRGDALRRAAGATGLGDAMLDAAA